MNHTYITYALVAFYVAICASHVFESDYVRAVYWCGYSISTVAFIFMTR